MYTIMLFLFLDWIIYGVLAAYLDQIIPTNDGVNKHPCFCFLDLRRRFSRNQRPNRVGDETADDILLQHRRHVSSIVDRESKEANDRAKDVTAIHEDADVIAE